MTMQTNFESKNGFIGFSINPMRTMTTNTPFYIEQRKRIINLLAEKKWKFIDRNVTDIDGKKFGHDIWGNENVWIRVSYPYVLKNEYDELKKVILKYT